jgi:hypothetical protein
MSLARARVVKAVSDRANLLPSWRSLSMRYRWRGQWHELTLPEAAEPPESER